MDSEGSITEWIKRAEAGDESAVRKLWERYFERLLRVARKRIRSDCRRAADEEDIVLSALNSFFQGLRQGRFSELYGRDDLWKLLVTITARKASDVETHRRRKKRGGGREAGESGILGHAAATLSAFDQIVSQQPTPEFAALMSEECERLLSMLADDKLRNIAVWKLEGHSNEEIGKRLGCSLRTVERKLWLIRTKWSAERGEP
jgi:RNA polymerase sigma factor (sigma-70 family)